MEETQYQTLKIEAAAPCLRVVINRPQERNALNSILLTELQDLFSQLEKQSQYKIIVLASHGGFFCTGMDFKELVDNLAHDQSISPQWANGNYMQLLRHMSQSSKVIFAEVDGVAMAGGIGILAACDFVIATNRSQFSLPEALWGLLPAQVLPYLIRRIGFQKAYQMTLSTQTLNAHEALECKLVDEVTDQPQEVIRKYLLRISRLEPDTIRELKEYFRKMWIINESMEELAAKELHRLVSSKRVQTNILNYVVDKKFPWEITS